MELMVVVVIVSVLTTLAMPAMRNARDDRLTFDYARRVEQLVQRARARAAGRGAAHLFVAEPSGTPSRGEFLLFEALDGTLPAAAGPNPVSSCKLANEWTDATTFAPGTVSNSARIIDGFNLDAASGINVNADIRGTFFVNGAATPAFVLCVTPNGNTYVGVGANMAAAITDMQSQIVPFNNFAEVQVTRGYGGSPVGLKRRVLMAGSAASRIKSE